MQFKLPFCLRFQLSPRLAYAIVILAILSNVPVSEVQADAPFQFEQDDVVAIFGNGLADRMQHEPWVETILQSNLKG